MSGSSGKLRNLISACEQLPDIPTPSETQVLSAIFQFCGVNASVFEGYDTGKLNVQICTFTSVARYCILLNRGGSWGTSHVPLGNGRPAFFERSAYVARAHLSPPRRYDDALVHVDLTHIIVHIAQDVAPDPPSSSACIVCHFLPSPALFNRRPP
jgi:hypothetical protein